MIKTLREFITELEEFAKEYGDDISVVTTDECGEAYARVSFSKQDPYGSKPDRIMIRCNACWGM